MVIRPGEKIWMKNYINKNSEIRAEAETEFGQISLKNLNCGLYGKQKADVWKRIEFVTTYESCLKEQSELNFDQL